MRRAVVAWLALQAGYQLVPDAWLAQVCFPRLLVHPVAWLVGVLGVPVGTTGTTLWLQHGSLAIVRGCDGGDLLCVLLALLAASPAPLRARLGAALLGSLLLHALNLLRLTCLCWLAGRHPEAFTAVHDWVAPGLLAGALGGGWWHWNLRQLRACAPTATTRQGSHLPPASIPSIRGSHADPP